MVFLFGSEIFMLRSMQLQFCWEVVLPCSWRIKTQVCAGSFIVSVHIFTGPKKIGISFLSSIQKQRKSWGVGHCQSWDSWWYARESRWVLGILCKILLGKPSSLINSIPCLHYTVCHGFARSNFFFEIYCCSWHTFVGNLLNLLDTSAAENVLPTTYGCLRPPLGKHRLKVLDVANPFNWPFGHFNLVVIIVEPWALCFLSRWTLFVFCKGAYCCLDWPATLILVWLPGV